MVGAAFSSYTAERKVLGAWGGSQCDQGFLKPWDFHVCKGRICREVSAEEIEEAEGSTN